MFCCVCTFWRHLGPFGCLTKLGAKQAETSAKVRAMKSCRNFSQRMHPIHTIGPLPHVLMCFVLFGCIWYHFVTLQNSVQNGLMWCKSSCHAVVSECFATNAPDPPHWTLKSCFGVFRTLWVHLAAIQNSVQNWRKWCKSSCHGVV